MGFAKIYQGGGPPVNVRPPSPLMLEFVDVQDPQSRSRARSHVVRGWRRQNRLKDVRSHQQFTPPKSGGGGGGGNRPGHLERRASGTKLEIPSKRQEDQSKSYRTISSASDSICSNSKSPEINIKYESEDPNPSPEGAGMLNDLGLYKTDPFNTLAIEINEPLQEALKHFVGFQAAASYSQGEHTSFNPNRNLVFWSSKSSVPAMHGLVAMAAIHEARLRGQRESTLCMHHMGESMRLLREKLVDISRNFSEIILTICGLACINEFREAYEQSEVHIRAVMQLLHAKGGLKALASEPRIQRYAAYMTTAGFSSGLPDLHPHKTTTSERLPTTPEEHYFDGLDGSQDVVEVHSHIGEFLSFISKIHKVTYKRNDEDRLIRPRQKTLFHHNGLFHSLLCQSETDHFRAAGLGNRRIHRAACLFHITLNLLDMADSPTESEEYLKTIQEIFVHNELNIRPNLRLFHHRLIQCENETGVANVDKTWQSMRFMQIFKLLTWDTGLRILTDLCHFLGMTLLDQPRPIMVFQHDLSTLVNEILEALTTDHQARRLGCFPPQITGLLVEEPVEMTTQWYPPRQES